MGIEDGKMNNRYFVFGEVMVIVFLMGKVRVICINTLIKGKRNLLREFKLILFF